MDYATNSDPLLRLALQSGIAVFAITLLLLAAILILRLFADHREAREATIRDEWQPVFLHAIDGLAYAMPRIHGRDRELILLVWLQFTEMLRGAARERLREMARELQLPGTALRLLHRGDMRGRLLATVGLGRMQASEAWDALARLMTDENPVSSLLAARSLLQIDAPRAAAPLMAAIARRDDWSRAGVATMLGDARDAALGPALLATLAASNDAEATRLLPLLDVVPGADRWPLLAPRLATEAPDTLVAALKAVADPRALADVRRLAGHAAWPVRAQAATTLARVGKEDDLALLQTLLADREWWVRYRAAAAMLRMPGVTREWLGALAAGATDRYAADMLRQVMAEAATGGAA
ncbi:MAG: HEAT repeat domain-containing protein [Rhodocyclales bacterium]|nr:HEAT repeat domain-containing protein [Rhodocyclales bacterium]